MRDEVKPMYSIRLTLFRIKYLIVLPTKPTFVIKTSLFYQFIKVFRSKSYENISFDGLSIDSFVSKVSRNSHSKQKLDKSFVTKVLFSHEIEVKTN